MGCFMKQSIRVMTLEELKILQQEEGYAQVLVEYHNELSCFSLLAGAAFEAFAARYTTAGNKDLLCVRIPMRGVKPRFLLIDRLPAVRNVDGALKSTDENSSSSVSTCASEACETVDKVRTNDDGVLVELGGRYCCIWNGSRTYYCGRILGTGVIPGSDGQCGPTAGPQCPSCKRYQEVQDGGQALDTPWFITVEMLQKRVNAAEKRVETQRFQACKIGVAVSQIVMG